MVSKGKFKKNISFFFPAFNEEATVKKMVIDAINVLESVADQYEIIIVDDGSLDDTAKIADEMARRYPQVKVIHHLYNIGYGAALKTGFASCKYDLIFYTDGDHQLDLAELTKLLPFIEEYDIISGYRAHRADSISRLIASKLYNFVIRTLFGMRVRDIDCAFKLFRRKVVQASGHYINNGVFICAEFFFLAMKQKYKIKQVPVHHYPRQYGKSSSFSFFFDLRSMMELAQTVWELRLKEKVRAIRRRLQERSFARRRTG